MAKTKPLKGTPRLDPYSRLLHRFYEPMVLLTELGPYQREYILVRSQANTIEAIRHQFIKNLAYVCDYRKGGDTTTAIALQQQDDEVCFWLSQNADDREETANFLGRVLQALKNTADSQDADEILQAETDLLDLCSGFAKERISKERGLLVRALKKCVLRKFENEEILSLLQKLGGCKNAVDTCQIAFQNRHIRLRHTLSSAIQLSDAQQAQDGPIYHYSQVRHHIGRLAHHIRVVGQLVEDSQYLGPLLEKFCIACVPDMHSVPAPQQDGLTNIDGVLKRMLPKDHPKLEVYKGLMEFLNQKFQIFDKFLAWYKNENWKPIVHCEIKMLEHFYHGGLQYLDDDRYIGCSKFSCLCCRLYFLHHPARCVEPESHQKVYPNWGPPLLLGGKDDPGYQTQLYILNKMNEAIRGAVIGELSEKWEKRVYRPDSVTGITSSVESYEFI